MEIGARIKELRIQNGLTQAQLAKALGVTSAAVGNYEQGISFPKETVLRKLFNALNCTPNELLSEEKYSAEDYEHLRLYSMLTAEGKRAVDEFTESELSKASEMSEIRIAARRGGSEITLKKRTERSIFDADDYNR
ncbi:MAG: helix-turn-helix transcriptional regulator [Oscillospiraceae bacterium]|nr:helix-turn-helix transcriptional regulator [Oscillospiraceae bacterium]